MFSAPARERQGLAHARSRERGIRTSLSWESMAAPLFCAKSAPFGESCGTVQSEMVSARETALLIEVVGDRGVD